MAFRRSAVRSRLAPPPHHRGRATHVVAAPLCSASFLLRALVVFGLVFGVAGVSPVAADPALAMARAAGALCGGMGEDGLPEAGQAHEHCLACQGNGPVAALPTGSPFARALVLAMVAPVRAAWRGGEVERRAHHARAPPAAIG